MATELTCLGLGYGPGEEWTGPSCCLLQASGVHLLLECPLDMSMLPLFLPASNGVSSASHKEPYAEMLSALGGHFFLDVEPWYKTANFSLVDVSCIDIVLVSNPQGMLGLPYLTTRDDFSGKIYATTVTAKLGQLMMEELVAMHAEYVRVFGRSLSSGKPLWLDPHMLDAFPESLKKALVDSDGVNRGNWHKLYSLKDIGECMKRVQCFSYDEEINIYDCLCIRPCSSGSELGASNWVISGARHVSYFSACQLMSSSAMSLNVASHVSSDTLLFCDLSSTTSLKVNGGQSLTSEGEEDSPIQVWSMKEAEKACHENVKGKMQEKRRHSSYVSVDDLSIVCKAVVDAVSSAGSVLVSINGYGALLELMEVISQALHASNLSLSKFPMFFISPVAEELLVYTNTIPEWLCAVRQEQLYAGEALFGHAELLQREHLHLLSTLHSLKTVKLWREPCIVFALGWGLRMGPAVPLLYKWRQDPRCLLIVSQTEMSAELALAPFQPSRMRTLVYNRRGKLGVEEMAAIIEKLRPDLSLLPETMKHVFQKLVDQDAMPSEAVIGFYNMWDVLTIPAPQLIEADLSAEVACQIHPKELDSGIAVAHTMVSVRQKAGRWCLELAESQQANVSTHENMYWGALKVNELLNVLTRQGLSCETTSQALDTMSSTSPCTDVVIITSPARAKVELRHDETVIQTDDAAVRRIIVDAVKSLLEFV